MRSHDGRFVGYGTELAFYEQEETWRNQAVDVRLPNDSVLDDPDALKQLSGPVVPRRIEDLEKEVKPSDQS